VKKKFFKNSPPKEMILAANQDPDTKNKTVHFLERTRPLTKNYNKPYESLNSTFTPYYGQRAEISQNRSKRQFSTNSSNGYLSQNGNISKPRTVEEWKRKHSKPHRNVILKPDLDLDFSKISKHYISDSIFELRSNLFSNLE
jgi:hypothetical protein